MATSEHRVVIDFGTVVTARLVCPENGCEPVVDHPDDPCWLRSWFEALSVEELLTGSIEVPIDYRYEHDHPVVTVRSEPSLAEAIEALELIAGVLKGIPKDALAQLQSSGEATQA